MYQKREVAIVSKNASKTNKETNVALDRMAKAIEDRNHTVRISKEDFGTLCVCAIRYCHGRKSYMPGLVQDIVREHIDEITERTLKVMVDDCDFQRTFDLYGDEKIDKPGWIEWERFLLEEQKDRITEK